MGCGNKATTTHYLQIVKLLNKCIVELQMDINKYKDIHLVCIKKKEKDIVKSILLDKESHKKILIEIYKIATGDDIKLEVIREDIKANNFLSLIESSIEKEFEYINLLKTLRYYIPDPNLKQAINIILIDENTILNKLLYIKK